LTLEVIFDPLPAQKILKMVSKDVSWHSVSISVVKKILIFLDHVEYDTSKENSRKCLRNSKTHAIVQLLKNHANAFFLFKKVYLKCGFGLSNSGTWFSATLKWMAWIVKPNGNFKLTFSEEKEYICVIFQNLYDSVSFRISETLACFPWRYRITFCIDFHGIFLYFYGLLGQSWPTSLIVFN